jgi:hypothetical protein
MKKLLKIAAGLLAAVFVAGATLLYGFPGKIVAFTQSQAASAAGVVRKSVTIEGQPAAYYDGGTGPTVILLHGMGDEKNSFVLAARELTAKYRVIMPDHRGATTAFVVRRIFSMRSSQGLGSSNSRSAAIPWAGMLPLPMRWRIRAGSAN